MFIFLSGRPMWTFPMDLHIFLGKLKNFKKGKIQPDGGSGESPN